MKRQLLHSNVSAEMFRAIDPKVALLCGLCIVLNFNYFFGIMNSETTLFSAISVCQPNYTRLERQRPPSPSASTTFHSYVDPLHDVDLERISFADLPLPIQVMENYKKLHSVRALKRNPDLEHRKFAIGFYSCPLQAGNRLHHYLNGTCETARCECLLFAVGGAQQHALAG